MSTVSGDLYDQSLYRIVGVHSPKERCDSMRSDGQEWVRSKKV
jgi:hypothetical protein